MKCFAFLFVLLPLCGQAGGLTLADISPHLHADAQIIWKAATNDLPKTLWTYEKHPEHFSAVTVSNALLLGKFVLKPFPKSFTQAVTLWDKQIEGDPQPDYFAVDPKLSFASFRRQRRHVGQGDASRAALVSRTWQYAAQLGLDRAQLAQGMATDSSSVSLCRTLDDIPFREDMEGLSVQYGDQGEIRFFTLTWPKLQRIAQERVINCDTLTRCIRALKTPVLPAGDEPDYLGRVKSLSGIRTLTVTNIALYYGEGRFGEQPDDTKPEKFVAPIAVLDAVASWETSNAPVKLVAPLLLMDANRLLSQSNAAETKNP